MATPPRLDEETPSEIEPVEIEGIAYDTKIEGDLDSALRQILEQSSILNSLADRPPPSEGALRRRIDDDRDRFQRALRSEGFYGGRVDAVIDNSVEPWIITIDVVPGDPFVLESYTIDYVGPYRDDPRPPDIGIDELGLELGMVARASPITDAEDEMGRVLAMSARPLARIIDDRKIVDHEAKTMTVQLEVDPGPAVKFGRLTLEGLEEVDQEYVERVLEWPEGELWDRRLLEDRRERLLDMDLFDVIKFERGNELDDEGRLPVTIELFEAKQRSIGAGISYSTDEKFGGEVFWEHRNFRGQGERLRIEFSASEVRQSALASYAKPNFLRLDQTLLLSTEFRHQDTDAYEENTLEGYVGLRRKFDEIWTGQIGVQPEISRVDDNGSDETTYTGVGLPVVIERDDSDDRLDPTEGTRLSLAVTPNVGDFSEMITFLSSDTNAAGYWTPMDSDFLTLAARGRLGALFGEDTRDLPGTKRFYAGGGGSIRGFEFQSVGPVDDKNDPEGGRSVIELGAEMRFRVTESIGFVPFTEGGTVYNSSLPDFSETMRWAAGVGLRYYTVAGPLRFDIAFPLNPRRQDEDFEFYVSFGQAF
jgi:translocation and assembly module TamA